MAKKEKKEERQAKVDFKMEIVWLAPQDLTPYQNNAKKHPTEQIDSIAAQIHKFGFDQPIVVDKNKVIIKGHGRREASMRLGLKQVPCVVREDLDIYEAMASRLGDNRVAESEWDKDMLRFEFGTLQQHEFDLKDTGFDLKEVDKIMAEEDVEEEIDEEEATELEEEAATQFIVAIHCADENQMKELYEELHGRGLEVKLIT